VGFPLLSSAVRLFAHCPVYDPAVITSAIISHHQPSAFAISHHQLHIGAIYHFLTKQAPENPESPPTICNEFRCLIVPFPHLNSVDQQQQRRPSARRATEHQTKLSPRSSATPTSRGLEMRRC
jgi:hypothetical protein